MFKFNFFETLNVYLSCKREPKVNENIDKKIFDVSREARVSILPISTNFDIDDLYPITDHVELWNIFIVGKDKTYILAHVKDPHIVPSVESLRNKTKKNVFSYDLERVMDRIWDQTLTGVKMQFYMVWNGKLFFVNTYPFRNRKSQVIGGVMFMRAFETMPDMKFVEGVDGKLLPLRVSTETPAQPKPRFDHDAFANESSFFPAIEDSPTSQGQ